MSAAMRKLLLFLPAFARASKDFLQPLPQDRISLTPDQHSEVLNAIEQALGTKNRRATEVRVVPIMALLEPTLAALPKNEHGRFGPKATRYALHRLFVQRHAWFVKDIGFDVVHSDQETPVSMLQGGGTELIQTLFETRFGTHGVDAHEMAVMAATLENLAHTEAMERIQKSYLLLHLSTNASNLTKLEVQSLLDVYMAAFVARTNLTQLVDMPKGHPHLLGHVKRTYPGWESVRIFARQVMNEHVRSQENFSFIDVSHVVTRIGDSYGRWQAYECDDLKRKLFSIEDDGTGRVSLSRFYNGALNQGHWQFSESYEYLRAAGILDESHSSNPRVIVANYILSPSNCVAASSYYSVCCLDVCEDLLDHLEHELRAPFAAPQKIVGLVAAMPPPSTVTNHTISASLLLRLGEIAAGSGGMVPLHGRSFAQWMHHVYPRDCPYPHVTGTTKSVRTAEFEEQTGKKAKATKEEMKQCIAESADDSIASNDIPWSDEDELFVEGPRLDVGSGDWSWAIEIVVFLVPVFSMLLCPFRGKRAAGTETHWEFTKSHLV